MTNRKQQLINMIYAKLHKIDEEKKIKLIMNICSLLTTQQLNKIKNEI